MGRNDWPTRCWAKAAERVRSNCWRRERDSNPRYGCPYTRFPSVRLQPLGHPSGTRVCAHYSPGGEADNSRSRCRGGEKLPSAAQPQPKASSATPAERSAFPADPQTMTRAPRQSRSTSPEATIGKRRGLAVEIDSWCPCASGLKKRSLGRTLEELRRREGIGAASPLV
jgi:hypothetical protein